MEGINFFSEDISFTLSQPDTISAWIYHVAKQEGYTVNNLNYVFCSDPYLHQINVDFLQHDTLTDIITFDTSEEEKRLEADIFISVERVKENAKLFDIPFQSELYRVMIHGLLHLVGFKDKSDEEKKEMRKKEEACLSLLNQLK